MAALQFVQSNNALFVLALLALAFGLWISQAIIRVRSNPVSRLPGPWYSKWTATVFTQKWLAGSSADYVNTLHQKYGPVVRIAPDYVVFADLPSVKRIHTVKHDFVKDKWYAMLTPGTVNVFTSTDPIHHRERRRLLSAPVADSSLKAMLPKIDARVQQTIVRMSEEMDSRGATDVFKWWFFMTTDVIGELSFGESFRMLDQGKKNQYIRDLEAIAKSGAITTSFPLLARLARAGVPVPIIKSATVVRTRVLQYAEESIQRYKRQLLAEPDSHPQTFFTRYFDKAGSEGLSDLDIRIEAMAYIIAGSDTTSNTLTYLVWSVCRNKDIQQALVKELQDLPDEFTDLDLRELRHLNNVINETLRLYPAAPALLPRVVPPGGETLAGHWLPGGTRVGTQAWTLHRLPKIFPDPLKFDPTRWDNPTREMKEAFMPFGGGSRICIGLHLARIELRLGVARFFRTFPNAHLSTREGMSDKDMDALQYFLIQPAGGRCLLELR